MKNSRFAVHLLTAAMACVSATHALAHEAHEKVTPAFAQAIPNIPGKSLIAVIVDYSPGAATASHLHAKSAFIYAYVLSGAIESQVSDGPTQILHAGESFYEPPGAKHAISRNASTTEPATLLAVFVVDSADKPLTTPLPTNQAKEN